MSLSPITGCVGSNSITYDANGNIETYPALTDPLYQEKWEIIFNQQEMSEYQQKVVGILQNTEAKQADIVRFIDSAPSFAHLLAGLCAINRLLLTNQNPANTELFLITLLDRLPVRLTFRLNQQITYCFAHIAQKVGDYVRMFYQTFEACRLLYDTVVPNNNILNSYIPFFPSDDKNSPCYVNPIAFWFAKNLSVCDSIPHFEPFAASSESFPIDLPKKKLEQFITLINCGFSVLPTANRLNPNSGTLTWQNLNAASFDEYMKKTGIQRHCKALLNNIGQTILIKAAAKSCPFLAPLMFIESINELSKPLQQIGVSLLLKILDVSSTLFSSIVERPELMQELLTRIGADPSASIVHFISQESSHFDACTLLLDTVLNKVADKSDTIFEILKILNANVKKAQSLLPYACTLAKKGGIKLCSPYAATVLASVCLFAQTPLSEHQIKLCANILLDKQINYPTKIPYLRIRIQRVHHRQLGLEMLKIIKSQDIPDPIPTAYWDIILLMAKEKIGLYIKDVKKLDMDIMEFYSFLRSLLFVMFTRSDLIASQEYSKIIGMINYVQLFVVDFITEIEPIKKIKTHKPSGAFHLVQLLATFPTDLLEGGEQTQNNPYQVWKLFLNEPNLPFPVQHRIWADKILSFMAKHPDQASFHKERLTYFLINYVNHFAKGAPLDHIEKIIQQTPLPITRELFVPLARAFPNQMEQLIGRKAAGKEKDWLDVSAYQPTFIDFKEVQPFIVFPSPPSKGAYTAIDISCLCTLFDQLNFVDSSKKDFVNPNKLIVEIDHQDRVVDKETFKGYLKQLVHHVTHYEPLAGAPADPALRKAFYDEKHNYLKLIAFLLLQEEPFENCDMLITLGQIGSKCATPYKDIPGRYHAMVQTLNFLAVPFWWNIPQGTVKEQRVHTIAGLSNFLPEHVGLAVTEKLKSLPPESPTQAFTDLQNSISFGWLLPWIKRLNFADPNNEGYIDLAAAQAQMGGNSAVAVFLRFKDFVGKEISKVLSGEASPCGSKLRRMAINLQKVDFAPMKQTLLKLMCLPAQADLETALDELEKEVETLTSLREPQNLREKVIKMFHDARWRFFNESLARKPSYFTTDIHNNKYIKSQLRDVLGIYESDEMQVTSQDNYALMACNDVVDSVTQQVGFAWNSACMVDIFLDSFAKPGGIAFPECRQWFKAHPEIKEEWEPNGEWDVKLKAASAAELLKSMGLLKKEVKQ